MKWKIIWCEYIITFNTYNIIDSYYHIFSSDEVQNWKGQIELIDPAAPIPQFKAIQLHISIHDLQRDRGYREQIRPILQAGMHRLCA